MAYDAQLADRIRDALAGERAVTERKMFGGLAFLVEGNMVVAASGKGGLMVRADPSTTAELVESTAAEYVVMRGRPMRGWIHLDGGDLQTDHELASWIDRAVTYSATLPHRT